MKTEAIANPSLDVIEIKSPSHILPSPETDRRSTGKGQAKIQAPSLSALLRGLGGLVIVVAFIIFLFKGWQEGDQLTRYLLLIGHTLVLSLAGFASGHLLHEGKGARLFIALALAAVPVNFAFLGSMSYAQLTWDPATTSQAAAGLFVPAASGEALSSATSLALTGAAIPVLGAAIWIGFLIMARRSAWPLTGLYLLVNMGLLIPTRDTAAISLILLALGVLLAFSVVRLSRRDGALATGEGIFARTALFLPLLVLAGRSVWLYAPGELFYTTLSLIGYLGLLQALRYLGEKSRWREAVEVLAVGLAFSTTLFAFETLTELHDLDAVFKLPIAAALFAALLVGLSRASSRWAVAYQSAAALVVAGTLVINLIFFQGPVTALACLIGGIGIQVYAYGARQQTVFAVALLVALIGLGDLGIEAVSSFTVGGWTGLVLVGVATVLAGSLIERHGRRFRAAMGSWNRHFRQTD